MPDPIKVEVLRDSATPALRELLRRVSPMRPALARLGKRGEVELRKYFRLMDTRKANRHGWPRQHFWARIRNATAFAGASETEARIVIADPAFGLHVRGGIVRPREKRALAIPLQALAYGKQPSAGLIPGLFVLRTKKAAYLVAYGSGETGKHFLGFSKGGKAKYSRDRATLHFYFILLKSATIRRDPTALPPENEFNDALLDEMKTYMDVSGFNR